MRRTDNKMKKIKISYMRRTDMNMKKINISYMRRTDMNMKKLTHSICDLHLETKKKEVTLYATDN